MTVYKPKIVSMDQLPADMEELLSLVADRSKYAGTALTVQGPITSDSMLGRLYKLGWVTFESQCATTCWALGCPHPVTHARSFTITRAGRMALDSLRGTNTMHTRAIED